MIRTILSAEAHGATWIDVTAPSREELQGVATRYGLHATSVEDCLDPEHLPKHERLEDAMFVILRVWGEQPGREGPAIQDVTRKIALFARGDLLLTIHRAELPVMTAAEREWTGRAAQGERCTTAGLISSLVVAAFGTYHQPLEQAEDDLAAFEQALFDPKTQAPDLLAIHQLKGRVGRIRRLLWLTSGVVHRAGGGADRTTPVYQDMRDTAESYVFYADQIMDEAQNLVSTYLAVASHRTNEVMRVLTVFSAFFLPLTFIVGVYGMNFRRMPELEWRLGYPLALGLMAAVCAAIFFWFRRRGWLRRVTGEE